MKSLKSALATATLVTAGAMAVSGCETMKTQPNSGTNNAPIPTSGVKLNADCSAGTIGSAKNSVLGSNEACVEISIYGAEKVTTQAAAKTAPAAQRSSTTTTTPETRSRKSGGAGTKGGNPVTAAAAPAAAQTSLKIVTQPTKTAIELSLGDYCGAKSTGIFGSVVSLGKGVLDKASTLAGKALEAKGAQVGGSIVGNGVLGNVGKQAGKDVATTVTRGAQTTTAPVASNAGNIANDATAKCEANVAEVANGPFTSEVKTLVKNWKSSNPTLTPVLTFSSTLPARQEEIVKKAVAAVAPIVTLAP